MTDREVWTEYKRASKAISAHLAANDRSDAAYEIYQREIDSFIKMRPEMFNRFKERAEKEATP